MKKTISILLVMLLLACNSNKKEVAEPQSIKKADQFSVYLKFKSNKQDQVKISLRNIVIDEFQSKTVIFQENIIPSENYDEMRVVFNPNDNSKNVVINLGAENEKIFEIKNIRLSYGGKDINIENANEFKKHFVLNKFVQLDSQNKIILKTSKINGKHNPVIYIKSHFLNRLFNTD